MLRERSPDITRHIPTFVVWTGPAVLSGGPSPRTEVIHQVSNTYFTEGIIVMQMGDMKLMQATKGPSKGVGDDRIIAWPKPGPAAVAYGQSGGLTEGGIGACRVGASKVKGGQNRKCMSHGCRAPTARPAPLTRSADLPVLQSMSAHQCTQCL